VTFLGDEIRKGISIIIEVWITSLNSHSLEFTLAQDFGGWQDRLLRDSDATMIMQP
jgi:hypothetical protein